MNITPYFYEVLAFWAISIAVLISATWIGLTYLQSPTWKEKGRFIIFLATIPASIVLVYFTKQFWGHPSAENPTTIYQLWMALYLAVTYLLLSLIPISFAAYKKDGFSELKKFRESGTINSMVFGLLPGIIVWAIFGLGNGLIIALSFCLIVGSLTGLKDEFKVHRCPQ